MRKSKYHGAGNDFLLIEDFEKRFPCESVSQLCNRGEGIGADGLLLLQHSECADFRMRIFNSDGSEPTMCGNGLRCFVQFLVDLGYVQESYLIETGHGVLKVDRREGKILTHLGKPQRLFWKRSFLWEGVERIGYGVHTGTPHAVFLEPISDFLAFAKQVREKEGANVNLVEILGPRFLTLRTYEKGVEGETLACGTGAAAAAYVASQLYHWKGWVSIQAQGGLLEVKVDEELILTGPVERIHLEVGVRQSEFLIG